MTRRGDQCNSAGERDRLGHVGPGAEEGLSSSHDTLPTVPRPNAPGGSWAPAPGSLVPSVAFANPTEARLPLGPARAGVLVTTLQASLHAADALVPWAASRSEHPAEDQIEQGEQHESPSRIEEAHAIGARRSADRGF